MSLRDSVKPVKGSIRVEMIMEGYGAPEKLHIFPKEDTGTFIFSLPGEYTVKLQKLERPGLQLFKIIDEDGKFVSARMYSRHFYLSIIDEEKPFKIIIREKSTIVYQDKNKLFESSKSTTFELEGVKFIVTFVPQDKLISKL